MKPIGCSIIFMNDHNQILLLLRDDKPSIPYPNMWDVPGGLAESGETPEQCIAREIKEEMELEINEFELISIVNFDNRIEHTFWKKANLKISEINLNEGQKLKWFTKDEVLNTELAWGFNQIIEYFFDIIKVRLNNFK